ncbi:hypothetical protein D3C84_248000 [compost metagenome]
MTNRHADDVICTINYVGLNVTTTDCVKADGFWIFGTVLCFSTARRANISSIDVRVTLQNTLLHVGATGTHTQGTSDGLNQVQLRRGVLLQIAGEFVVFLFFVIPTAFVGDPVRTLIVLFKTKTRHTPTIFQVYDFFDYQHITQTTFLVYDVGNVFRFKACWFNNTHGDPLGV